MCRRRDAGSGRPESHPESALEASRDRQLVWRALRSLSQLSREVILLKEIQGFTLEEIAAMLRAPIGTVKSRASRARWSWRSRC